MIRAYTPINNLEYTVQRPIVASLVKHFATRYLKNPEIPVLYTSEIDKFGEGVYSTDYNMQYNKQWLTVDYEIRNDDSYMTTNSLRGNDGIILFKDTDIDYYIKAVPITEAFTVTIKIFDKFKNRLTNLLNNFKLGELKDSNYLILNADAFFTIPGNIVKLTKIISNLKYGPDVTWDQYFTAFSTLPLDNLNSKSGDKYTKAFKMEYRDIAVWTEVGFLDKEIAREDKGFSLEVVLKFSFDVITNLSLAYPILVCNKLIDKEYLLVSDTKVKKYALPIERSTLDDKNINRIATTISGAIREQTKDILETMDVTPIVKLIEESPELQAYGNTTDEIINTSIDKYLEDMYKLNYTLKRISPIYDNWRSYINYGKMEPINILLLQIKHKSYTYLNLYELTELGYNLDFINYLIDNKEKLLTLYSGLFHLNIYNNNEVIGCDEIDIITEDETIDDLGVSFKRGDVVNRIAIENNLSVGNDDDKVYLNTLKYYHMVLYIANDTNYINQFKNEDMSLLLQYVTMNNEILKNLNIENDSSIMKTVMQFSLLAHGSNSNTKIINTVLKNGG